MISAFSDDRRINLNFVCQNCVQVKKELIALIPRSQPSLKTAAELSKLRETVVEKESTIKKLKTNEHHLLEIVESQKDELSELKQKMSDDPALHTVEYVEVKLEKKLDDFRKEILSTIKEECTKSYAKTASGDRNDVSSNNEIKLAVKEVHKEEAEEEKDKKRRSKNILIHGVKEATEDLHKRDEEWVKALIQNLHVKVNIKQMKRLGAKADNKKRPLLISLENEEEKEKVFGNLHALKGNSDYKGMSICEDLTPEQRKVFKDLVNDAKAKNGNETDGVWRVRGSSKNGFRLKKVMVNDPQHQ